MALPIRGILDHYIIIGRLNHVNRLILFPILIILLFAIFFRTYSWHDRIFVHADNSRDVQVARYAADNFKIPLVGQFSSAGPFFYGPWYYWFLALVSFIPLGFFTHWYVMTFLYLILVVLIFFLGARIGGTAVGLVAAFYAAISTSQINFSLAVWNVSIVPILGALTLVVLFKFLESQKLIFLFFLGFVVSVSVSIHLQTLMTLPILGVALVWEKPKIRTFFRNLAIVLAGVLVAFAPLIFFDIGHNFYNFKNFLIFITVDQYKIYIPNRWLTYIWDYWPQTWSYIIGGYKYIGTIIIAILSILTVLKIKSWQNHKAFFLVAAIFLFEVVLFRYYRGEKHVYYTLFTHPYVLLLTAWITFQIFRFNNFLGVVLFGIITIATFNQSLADLDKRGTTLSEINSLKSEIYAKNPDVRFDIYGCQPSPNSISHPMALSMYVDGRNDVDGVKVSVCEVGGELSWINIAREYEQDWKGKVINRSTQTVYLETAEWWKTKPPVSGEGNFWRFIFENSPIFH